MLNFGHTIGHAIEGCYGFGHYTHGEGVAAGMSMLTGVTEAMGLTKAGTTARLRKVLEQYGLPIDVDASAEELIPYISNDKVRGLAIHHSGHYRRNRQGPPAASCCGRPAEIHPKEGRPMNIIITPHTLQGTVKRLLLKVSATRDLICAATPAEGGALVDNISIPGHRSDV